jgi:hypothetical protein
MNFEFMDFLSKASIFLFLGLQTRRSNFWIFRKKNKRPMGLIGHLSIMQQLSNALIWFMF